MMLFSSISYPYNGWVDDLRIHLESDPWIQSTIKELQGKPNPKFSFSNGFLRYKGRILIGPQSDWKKKVIFECHDTPAAGHLGVHKTKKRVSRVFYWKGQTKDIKNYVAGCSICQRNKSETVAPPGFLQPLLVPSRIWSEISMDFIE